MYKVKTLKNLNTPGRLIHQRMIIKGFKTSDLMHKWLNDRCDNLYSVYDGPLKPGTYAFAGGQWHNVKSLDPSVLAHI